MKKGFTLIKNNVKVIFAFVLGAVIFGGGVYAVNLLNSAEVAYSNGKSNVTNVKDALDELYNKRIASACQYGIGQAWDFAYTGDIQSYAAPCSGLYKLEVWGAQGGTYDNTNYGGYGGYATGIINFEKGNQVYVTVGGEGTIIHNTYVSNGGYNGGGGAHSTAHSVGTGGGATHIATSPGLLRDLSSNKNAVLIVAGGGGGSYYEGSTNRGTGGNGGGYIGGDSSKTTSARSKKVASTGGTQTSGGSYGMYYNSSYPGMADASNGSFGLGGQYASTGNDRNIPGGGGGWYGGGATCQGAGSGGSGYISSLLTDKKMVCHQCATSDEASTKTESNTCVQATSASNCSKQGNGHAKITLVSLDAE